MTKKCMETKGVEAPRFNLSGFHAPVFAFFADGPPPPARLGSFTMDLLALMPVGLALASSALALAQPSSPVSL